MRSASGPSCSREIGRKARAPARRAASAPVAGSRQAPWIPPLGPPTPARPTPIGALARNGRRLPRPRTGPPGRASPPPSGDGHDVPRPACPARRRTSHAMSHAIATGTGADVGIEAADVVLIAGRRPSSRPPRPPSATAGRTCFRAFACDAGLIPVAAGTLGPLCGLLLSPIFAGAIAFADGGCAGRHQRGLATATVLALRLRMRRGSGKRPAPATAPLDPAPEEPVQDRAKPVPEARHDQGEPGA